jgi:hypothetical protein
MLYHVFKLFAAKQEIYLPTTAHIIHHTDKCSSYTPQYTKHIICGSNFSSKLMVNFSKLPTTKKHKLMGKKIRIFEVKSHCRSHSHVMQESADKKYHYRPIEQPIVNNPTFLLFTLSNCHTKLILHGTPDRIVYARFGGRAIQLWML